MKFTFSSGDRVLESYTIKRGIGKGGFGEVYYALSDGGKEVALKLVTGGNLDIELRGMAQCLNLKNPHLLTLFDIRRDSHGDHWVIMEYIAGEALSAVLNRYPTGVPVDLTLEWFATLCKAVGYLHDQGIVHRDLKPGNIFVENGVIKVGDYGLCKLVSSSQRTAQTQSVGTVHYMAPEISTGNYNKQIDVYAAGVILYEMLTGRVPFDGESAGEILMKHLTTPPDLTRLAPEFREVVAKALHKNPVHRYQTMGELAQDLERLRRRDVVLEALPADQPRRVKAVVTPPPLPPIQAEPVTLRTQIGELCFAMGNSALIAGMLLLMYTAASRNNDMLLMGMEFLLTVSVCWGVLIPAKIWDGHKGEGLLRRIMLMIVGFAIGAEAFWLAGFTPRPTTDPYTVSAMGFRMDDHAITAIAGYLSYFGLSLFAMRWWTIAERSRSSRFSLFPLLCAAFWGLILTFLWPHTGAVPHGAVALVMAAGIVQVVSPWQAPRTQAARKMKVRYA